MGRPRIWRPTNASPQAISASSTRAKARSKAKFFTSSRKFEMEGGFPFASAQSILPQKQSGYRVINSTAKRLAIAACVAALLGTSAVFSARAETPDFTGVWLPDIRDQKRQETANMPPWKP